MTSFSPAKTKADKSPIGIIVPPFGNSVCQSGEETPVGNVLPEMSDEEPLTRACRDQAIELAELLEIKFELQGKSVQAAYAAHLRRQLEASRRGEPNA